MLKETTYQGADKNYTVINQIILFHCENVMTMISVGAQWLSSRELDSRQRGRGFEPQQLHCVISLSKTHLSLLSTGSTQEH